MNLKPRIEKKSLTLAISFLLMISFFQIVYVPKASAQGTTLSAPTILDETLTSGSTFHINITVADVSAMWGYEFVLGYDTSILTATSYSTYDPFILPWPSEINDAEGYVAVAYTMMFGELEGFSTVDPAPIARIDFTVDAEGESALDLYNTVLTDIYGEVMLHDVLDGHFSNLPVRHDVAVVNVIAEPTLAVPGSLVSIYVTVANEGNTYETFEVTAYYNDTVVALSQSVTDIVPKTNRTLTFIWNTTGLALGSYVISAEASVVAGETDTADNVYVDGTVIISTAVEVGWIEGTVTDADTMLPIEGATVSTDAVSDVTDSLGFYSLEVSPGTYDVTAAMTGYLSQTVTGVSVSADETVTQDFALTHVVVPNTVISVEPATILDQALGVGSTFSINITVADVSEMWGYEFVLGYDTSILTATSYSTYDPFTLPWPSEINDAEGYVIMAYSMMFGETEGFSTVDPAPVARIDFTVDAEGLSLLDLYNTLLTNIYGDDMPHDVVDGYFSNIEVTLYVLTIMVDGFGTTDPAPGDHTYPESTVVSVDAIPDEGYMLDHWELDTVDVGDADPYSVTMDTDHALTAVFKEITRVHDIAITSVSAYPTTVKAGEVVEISVTVENEGTETETFTVTIYYDDVTISVFTIFGLNPGETRALKFGWSTLTVTPGTYTLKAVASTVPGETDIEDNTFIDGTVTIIPPPIPRITIDPESGPVGTKVTVNGSDFPVQAGLYLMFDDQLVGFLIPTDQNGNFTVTFNVPLSEAGEHTVKVWTMYYPLDFYSAEAPFTVIDTTPLNVDADVGAIYFKEETAEFYVQTSFKGVPVDVTSIEVTLYKPDETAETLTAQRIATGLYKIEYRIKGKNSMLGAYTLVVEASYSSTSVNATGTSLKTFIVKSPWRELERQAPKVALSVATIAAAIALVMVWRRKD